MLWNFKDEHAFGRDIRLALLEEKGFPAGKLYSHVTAMGGVILNTIGVFYFEHGGVECMCFLVGIPDGHIYQKENTIRCLVNHAVA